MTLPPCHTDFQFYTRELREIERYVMLVNLTNRPLFFLDKGDGDVKMREFMEECDKLNIPTRAISLQWSQRSVDSFLGLPFNIASYGLLLEIIAKEVNMVPDELIGNLGDTHLYLNHIEQAKEQIGRELSQTARYNLLTKQMTKLRAIRDEDYIKYNIPTRTREPFPLPKLMICGDMRRTDGFTVPFDELDHGLLKLIDYQSHPTIKAPLSN